MHSSLPQQLTNFAYSKSRVVKAVFAGLERFVVRRSRVVIVICPQLEDVVRGIDAAVPSVLIENAPGSGDAPTEGSRAAPSACALEDRCRRADGALHRHVRSVSGARSAVRVDADRARGAARHAAGAGRRAAGTGRGGAQAGRGGAGSPARRSSRGSVRRKRSPRSSTPPTCWCRRAASAPTRRSRFTSTSRSGRPIVATRLLTHTQVLDDEVAFLTEATPEGFGAGIARGARRSGARPRRRRARPAARRDQVQLRGLPGAHAPGLRAPLRRSARRRSQAAWRDRDPQLAEPLQLRRLRRSGDGGALRRDALQRADRPAHRRDAGAADCRVSRAGRRTPGARRRDRDRPRGDRAGEARRDRDRRRRVRGDARGRRAARAGKLRRQCDVRARRRASASTSPIAASTRSCACAC